MSLSRSALLGRTLCLSAASGLVAWSAATAPSHAQTPAPRVKGILLPATLSGDVFATFDSTGTVTTNGVTATRTFHDEARISNVVFTHTGLQRNDAVYDLTEGTATLTGHNVLTQTVAGTGCTTTQTVEESGEPAVGSGLTGRLLLNPHSSKCTVQFQLPQHLQEHIETVCDDQTNTQDHEEDFMEPLLFPGKTKRKKNTWTLNFNGQRQTTDHGFKDLSAVTCILVGVAH